MFDELRAYGEAAGKGHAAEGQSPKRTAILNVPDILRRTESKFLF